MSKWFRNYFNKAAEDIHPPRPPRKFILTLAKCLEVGDYKERRDEDNTSYTFALAEDIAAGLKLPHWGGMLCYVDLTLEKLTPHEERLLWAPILAKRERDEAKARAKQEERIRRIEAYTPKPAPTP